jgi:hypothetical protein
MTQWEAEDEKMKKWLEKSAFSIVKQKAMGTNNANRNGNGEENGLNNMQINENLESNSSNSQNKKMSNNG